MRESAGAGVDVLRMGRTFAPAQDRTIDQDFGGAGQFANQGGYLGYVDRVHLGAVAEVVYLRDMLHEAKAFHLQ